MCRQLFTRFQKACQGLLLLFLYLKTLPHIEESFQLKELFTDHMLHLPAAFEQKIFHVLC
jgi:hypothetical protein